LYYENSKKTDVGLAGIWRLFVGESRQENSDLNVKTVVFSSLVTPKNRHFGTVLYGLKNGFLNGRLLRF
jgi:hypothetical protein|tara:strand:- start:335 stop:541 length:207 start_codon:yes stop_codon:yes gene_type:complete